MWSRGRLCSRVRAGKAESGAKFADYFELSEPLAELPSHRILALSRGEREEVLTLELVSDSAGLDRSERDRGEPNVFERKIANRFKIADRGLELLGRERPGMRVARLARDERPFRPEGEAGRKGRAVQDDQSPPLSVILPAR